MDRGSILYGYKLSLRADSGFVIGTNSALVPIGVLPPEAENDQDYAFQNTVFTIYSGDGELSNKRAELRHFGDEVKFGHVVRLVQRNQNKVVATQRRYRAAIEKTCQRVTLEGIHGDWGNADKWKIMPRYKVRGEGEKICNGDHIILQSMVGDSLYLHLSTQKTDDGWEVNCSGTATGMELRAYDTELRRSEFAEERELRGGDCITLFHKEERAFVTRNFRTETQDSTVQLKQRDEDHTGLSADSNALFVLEFSNRYVGGIVTVGTSRLFRLKSPSTGAYICLLEETPAQGTANASPQHKDRVTKPTIKPVNDKPNYIVGFSYDPKNDGTLFCFRHATDETGIELKNRCRVYLQCPKLGQWIIAGEPIITDNDQTRQGMGRRKRSVLGMPTLMKDPMVLRGAAECSPRDGIEIQRLDAKDYQHFNVILSLIPPLKRFVGMPVLDFPTMSKLRENLCNLGSLCMAGKRSGILKGEIGSCDPDAQQRLNDQTVAFLSLKIIEKIMSLPAVEKSKLHSHESVAVSAEAARLGVLKFSDVKAVLFTAFNVVRTIVRGQPGHSLELASFLSFIVECIPYRIGALECLTDLFDSNIRLIEVAEKEDLIGVLSASALRTGRRPQLLNFLRMLVECNGEGLKNNQDRVIRQLISDPLKSHHNIFLSYVADGDVVYLNVPRAYFDVNPKSLDTLQKAVVEPVLPKAKTLEDARWVSLTTLSQLANNVEVSSTNQPLSYHAANSIINFLPAQLNILAALCRGGNKAGVAAANKFVQPKCYVVVATKKEVHPLLRAAFVKLFIAAVIEGDGSESKLDLLRSVKRVINPLTNEVEREEVVQIPRVESITEMKTFANALMSDPSMYQMSEEHSLERWIFVESVMQLVISLVGRGFYAFDEYSVLLEQMLLVIDKRNDKTQGAAKNAAKLECFTRIKTCAIRVLDMMIEFVTAMKVESVIEAFLKKRDPPHVSQLVDVLPGSELDHDSEMLRASKEQVDNPLSVAAAGVGKAFMTTVTLGGLLPFGRTEKQERYTHLTRLYDVLLLAAGDPADARIVLPIVKLFIRLVNQPANMYNSLKNVILLTGAKSVLFYDEVKKQSSVLEKTMLAADLEPAEEAVEIIRKRLEQDDGPPHEERLFILRHLQVHEEIIAIMPILGPKDVSTAAALLEVLGILINDHATAVAARSLADNFCHFCGPELTGKRVIEILSKLFVGHRAITTVKSTVFQSVATALVSTYDHRFAAADLMKDLLTWRRHSISRNQAMAWKAVNSNALPAIQLYKSWLGKAGLNNFVDMLSNKPDEYYRGRGELAFHVKVVELICAFGKDTDSAMKDEIRHVVLGQTALDNVMDIVSDPRFPRFVRSAYCKLLLQLWCTDSAVSSELYDHDLFVRFIEVCRMDMMHLMSFIADPSEIDPPTISLSIKDVMPYVPPPRNKTEEGVIKSRSTITVQYAHISEVVLPLFSNLFTQISAVPNDITDQANEVVDMACDITTVILTSSATSSKRQLFTDKSKRDTYHFLTSMTAAGYLGSQRWADTVEDVIGHVEEELGGDVASPAGVAVESPQGVTNSSFNTDFHSSQSFSQMDLTFHDKWKEFMEDWASSDDMSVDNLYVCGSFVLLTMPTGTLFVSQLIQTLTNRQVTKHTRVDIMDLLRQVVGQYKDHKYNDTVLITLPEPSTDSNQLTVSRTVEQKQTILAGWKGSTSLLCILIDIVPTSLTIFDSAMRCSIQLLEGGHRQMQESVMAHLHSRSDEEIFMLLRTRLMMTIEEIRMLKVSSKMEAMERSSGVPSTESTTLMLRFIQQMCEGHYLEMQNYMRIQVDNQVTINVLEQIVALLAETIKAIDASTYELLMQLLATVAETIQGPCKPNQDDVAACGFGAMATKILHDPFDGCGEEQKLAAIFSVTTVILSLIEGHMDLRVVSAIIGSCDLVLLCSVMDGSWVLFRDANGLGGNVLEKGMDMGKDMMKGLLLGHHRQSEFDDELAVGINIFVFFKAMLNVQTLSLPPGGEFKDALGCTLKEALRTSNSYKEFNHRVAGVEINRIHGLEVTYFRIPRICIENLGDRTKETLIKEVERESDNARLQDFFDRSMKLIFEIEFYEDLRKQRFLAVIHEYSHLLDNLSLAIAFALNLFLLFAVDSSSMTENGLKPGTDNRAFRALGITQLVIQSLLFTHFFFGPMKLYLKEQWLNWQDERNQEAVSESQVNLSIEPADVQLDRVDRTSWAFFIPYSVYFLMSFSPFWQSLLFVICAYIGFYVSPMWYSLQLLQVLGKNDRLYNVLLSVTKNGWTLLLTACLLVIVVYIFAISAFYTFSEDFNAVEDFGQGFNCDTLLKCSIIMLTSGLRNGGGIGDAMGRPIRGTHEASRIIYDFLFFLVLIVIFLNIVFGIIIDTFAELREQRNFVDNDQTQKCFICGIARNDFDRASPGLFNHHVRTEHNMWHYLFFMQYLRTKPATEHNGQETYVWTQMNMRESSFFPIGKSLSLRGNLADEIGGSDDEGRQVVAGGGMSEEQFHMLLQRLDSIDQRLNPASTPSKFR